MRSLLMLCALIAAGPLNAAQTATPDTPPPAPPNAPERAAPPQANSLPVPDSIQLVRDVVYASAPLAAGGTIELKMDVAFLKQSDGKPMPVAMYIHGGGWKGGSKEMGLRPNMALALGGYFAVTIQYRLTDQAIYPAAVHDCKAAIRFLRANAETLGIDPERIGVWGHSAGGHLAALLGATGNTDVLNGSIGAPAVDSSIDTKVQCVIDISGPIDLTRDFDGGMVSQWLGGPVRERQEIATQASPLTHIDSDDPPVLIIHGTEDRLVNIDRHARPFEAALKAAGVRVEFLPVEGAGHMISDPRVYHRAAEFFDEHLGGHAAGAVRDFLTPSRTPTPAATPRQNKGE